EFFFQAEDGIRDRNVTGVQTCALPIFNHGIIREVEVDASVMIVIGQSDAQSLGRFCEANFLGDLCEVAFAIVVINQWRDGGKSRSEERRVGKECGNEEVRRTVREKVDK